MRSDRLSVALITASLTVTLAVGACTKDSGNPGGGGASSTAGGGSSGGGTPSSGGGGTGGSASGGGNSGGGGGAADAPPAPEYVTACANPEVTLGGLVSVPGKQIVSAYPVYNGHTAILAYQTTTDFVHFATYAQKLTPTGALDGPASLVAKHMGGQFVAVASNGDDFLFCWADPNGTLCDAWKDGQTIAHAPPQNGSGLLVWSVAGYLLMLGIENSHFQPTKTELLKLDGSAMPIGMPVTIQPDGTPFGIVPTQTGFIAMIGDAKLQRLDASFHPIGNAVSLPHPDFIDYVAPSGDKIAVIYDAVQGMVQNYWISVLGPDDSLTTPVLFPKEASVVGAKASFALAYMNTTSNQTVYAPIAVDGTIGTEVPLFASIQPSVSYSASIAQVADGFLVTSNVTADASDVQIAHLACP